MEVIKSLIFLGILFGLICFVIALGLMASWIQTVYRVSPGGWLNGAQTFLLFSIALYCWGRASSGRW
jgi:hypothetical protein